MPTRATTVHRRSRDPEAHLFSNEKPPDLLTSCSNPDASHDCSLEITRSGGAPVLKRETSCPPDLLFKCRRELRLFTGDHEIRRRTCSQKRNLLTSCPPVQIPTASH